MPPRWSATATTSPAGRFLPPMRDCGGYSAPWRFGSAHPSGFSMALCDGSVKLIDFGIDPDIHRSMGNRKDGLPAENPLP